MTEKELLKAISIIVKRTVQETVRKEMKHVVTEMLKSETPGVPIGNNGTGYTNTHPSTTLEGTQNILESLISTAKPIPQGDGGYPTMQFDTRDVHNVANGTLNPGQTIDRTVGITAPGGTYVDKTRVPEKVAQNINRDYSALMKKLNNR